MPHPATSQPAVFAARPSPWRAFVAATAIAATLAGGANADPPIVAHASPDMADIGIDPDLSEIVIRFDRDMSPLGHSICGGGPTFPTLTGKPRWSDARTIILPVHLTPDTRYDLSINCSAAQNFRAADGTPATQYPISFRTARAGEATATLTPDQSRAAFARLKSAIDGTYAYRDLDCRGGAVDWAASYKEFQPRLESAPTPGAFGRIAAELLRPAADIHMTIQVGEFLLATGSRSVTPNVNPRGLKKVVSDLAQPSPSVLTGRVDGGLHYVAILSWSGPRESLEPAFQAVRLAQSSKGLIVDVRANAGGDELLAREFAALFATSRAAYSKNRFRDQESADGFGPLHDRFIDPATPDHPAFDGRVCVLIGPYCMSSCESFALMMRHGAQAPLIGETTYGSSGNPRPIDLGCGVTVNVPTWQDFQPDGTLVEGVGITPDQAVPTTPEALAESDPIVEAAAKWLRSKP
ncbi:MAG: hypothetical protein KF745_11235 [Phycisphaeraceae bacterium]|nr:hypothetical protein [Phycisphaeraceae bacterium]